MSKQIITDEVTSSNNWIITMRGRTGDYAVTDKNGRTLQAGVIYTFTAEQLSSLAAAIREALE